MLIQYLIVFAGVFSSEATPVPIPNTEVKLACGDGIAGLSLWESSTTPALFYNPGLSYGTPGFLFLNPVHLTNPSLAIRSPIFARCRDIQQLQSSGSFILRRGSPGYIS